MKFKDFYDDLDQSSIESDRFSFPHHPKDKYRQRVEIVPIEPKGWRDAWTVLRGRYRVTLKARRLLDSFGLNLILKETWTSERIEKSLYSGAEYFLKGGDAA